MTNTKCPSCNVMLDLRKFATGACEWCGERLPHDMVTHARERVAAREEGHRRIESTAQGRRRFPARNPTPSSG
ncbi:hypothetical protein [Zavarzinella formosa]|uniref:hypothetical protein n=1 Tax=Zavarzinella formosa TaxID=360055 RepID=UPI0002F440B4|nr:hypothetical protein [Zavarzinella formosa]